ESLLEQISSFEKSITLPDAERITGRTGLKKVHALAEFMVAKDLKGALGYLNELNDEGHNLVQFAKDLIHYLRKVLSLKVNPTLDKILEKDLTKEELAAAKKL